MVIVFFGGGAGPTPAEISTLKSPLPGWSPNPGEGLTYRAHVVMSIQNSGIGRKTTHSGFHQQTNPSAEVTKNVNLHQSYMFLFECHVILSILPKPSSGFRYCHYLSDNIRFVDESWIPLICTPPPVRDAPRRPSPFFGLVLVAERITIDLARFSAPKKNIPKNRTREIIKK